MRPRVFLACSLHMASIVVDHLASREKGFRICILGVHDSLVPPEKIQIKLSISFDEIRSSWLIPSSQIRDALWGLVTFTSKDFR